MTLPKTGYSWGKSSKQKLDFLHDDLFFLLTFVLHYLATTDISIVQVLRTLEEHKANLASGKSKAKVSRHLPRYMKFRPMRSRKRAGYPLLGSMISHAVDVVAWKHRRTSIEPEYYYAIAEAMRIASKRFGIPVIWGGCWQRLDEISCIKTAVDDYIALCKKEKRKPFLDLGHFELPSSVYPGLVKRPKGELAAANLA